jgi:CelD/BcsL family acetyltransferase involved in cellulose biosynthesis
VEGLPLTMGLAAPGGDVRSAEHPGVSSRIGVMRMSLSEALGLGSAAWDALQAGSASPSPFMTWAWHRSWADSAPREEVQASEALALYGADGSLEALLPIRLGRVRFRRVWVRALTWAIGDTGCPDELEVPGLANADWPALAAAVERLPWQVIILSNLAAGAPNMERLSAALVERGHAARQRALWPCPRLDLPASWDAYLGTLSANRRQIVRRKERSLRSSHAVAVTDYAAERLDEGWAHLMALHQQRWEAAGGGAFRDPRTVHLQLQFARDMAQRQRLWLTTLDLDGQPAAAWYGFASGDTVYFYQGGRDPRWERESVGLVLMGIMIRRAIERGYRAFNFLRGDDPYKQQWTSSRRMTSETVVFRSGWGGRWLRALDAVAALRRSGPDDA